jgi:glycogen debranching enzyme
MMKLLDQTARDILRLNDRGGYTVPTEGLYPYQWNWDSAFAAMGFAQFNVDRAWVEFETLFSGQWDNGMVPHILFHQVDEDYFPGPEMWKSVGPIPSSGITQPPVAATMARLVFERNPNVGLARLAPLYDKIVAWHDWFMAWRLDQGAVCTTHPWETGRDNAPDWDGAMAAIDPVGVGEYRRRDTSHVDSEMRPTREDYDRYVWLVQRGARLNWDDAAMLQDTPFRMADPSMTFTLMRAQRDLAELGRSLGRDVSTIEGQIAKLESGAQTLWNETLGCYDSRDTRTGEWANSISNASFLCWYGGLPAPQMRAVLTHVLEGVTYGVPSFTPHDPKFEAKRYWRGPVWAVMNMLIGMGLDEMDLPEGQVLREGTADLITKHGFSEYFDPLDGSPAGGGTFTWTAAVWLGWASPDAGQNS